MSFGLIYYTQTEIASAETALWCSRVRKNYLNGVSYLEHKNLYINWWVLESKQAICLIPRRSDFVLLSFSNYTKNKY